MQQILGYAPIEPDGSFKLTVPADTPIGLAVVNGKGERLQTHTNWIQVRPGERRTCDGCHSPRRGGAINSGAVVNTTPAGASRPRCRPRTSRARRWPARAPASTRTMLKLVNDMIYSDYWADTTKAGRHRAGRRSRSSTPATPNPADDLVDGGAGQRHRQLPDPRRAAVDAQPRRQHLHRLPQRSRQARPERVDLGHRPRRRRIRSSCSAIRSSTRSPACR